MNREEHRAQLQDPRWQKRACEIKTRDGWACQDCGSGLEGGRPLIVHHLAYTADSLWNEPDENLLTLCDRCHANRRGESWISADLYVRRLALFGQKLSVANRQVVALLAEADRLKKEAQALSLTGADIRRARE